jgi:dihydroorotate dehydrogenase electron transfer subunit
LSTTATSDRNPLHADFYADGACQVRAKVVENVRLARDTYRIRFDCPEIARRIVPGQFLMLRLAGLNDPLLGRPLALYNTVVDGSGEPTMIDVVYLRLGKMTSQLVHFAAGDELDVCGPLGNGFPAIATEQLIMVAGGIGQTPFLALGKEYLGRQRYGKPRRSGARASRVTLCCGVRTADYLAGIPDFESAGFDVRLASDDGSVGRHGFVTEVLNDLLVETEKVDRVVMCCGPEPMMHAVAKLCEQHSTRCLVSLETPMACGIGICFSCVTKVRQADGGWDYKRTCVEGPIFDAQKIEW